MKKKSHVLASTSNNLLLRNVWMWIHLVFTLHTIYSLHNARHLVLSLWGLVYCNQLDLLFIHNPLSNPLCLLVTQTAFLDLEILGCPVVKPDVFFYSVVHSEMLFCCSWFVKSDYLGCWSLPAILNQSGHSLPAPEVRLPAEPFLTGCFAVAFTPYIFNARDCCS